MSVIGTSLPYWLLPQNGREWSHIDRAGSRIEREADVGAALALLADRPLVARNSYL
jgi:hypothetical protein